MSIMLHIPIILTILGWSNLIITSASCKISDWNKTKKKIKKHKVMYSAIFVLTKKM